MKKKKDWRTILIGVITAADAIYQLYPADIIPDVVPVAGQADDTIALVANVLITVGLLIGKYRKYKEIDEKNA